MKNSNLVMFLFSACLVACGSPDEGAGYNDGADAGFDSPEPGADFFTLTITRSGEGEGEVHIAGQDVACDAYPCVRQAVPGAIATLSAEPVLESSFGGFSGACAGMSVCEVVMDRDVAVDASFVVAGKLLAQRMLADRGQYSQAAISDPDGNSYVSSFSCKEKGFGCLTKYSASGDVIWTSEKMSLMDVTLGPNGEVYGVGHESVSSTHSLYPVVRLDPATGNTIWRIDGSGGRYSSFWRVIADDEGQVFVGANIYGTENLSIAGENISKPTAEANHKTAVVIRLSASTGGFLSASQISQEEKVSLRDMIKSRIGGGVRVSAAITDSSTSDTRQLMVWVDGEGDIPGYSIAPTGEETFLAIRYAPDGNLIGTGNHQDAIDWGDAPNLQAPPTAINQSNMFIAKVHENGTPLWVKSYGGGIGISPQGLHVSSDGTIFVAANIRGDGSPNLGGDVLPKFGQHDIAVASYSSDGEHRWSHVFGGSGDDYALDLYATENTIRLLGGTAGSVLTELGQLTADETFSQMQLLEMELRQ